MSRQEERQIEEREQQDVDAAWRSASSYDELRELCGGRVRSAFAMAATESAYCPNCGACTDDVPHETIGGWELLTCPECGAEINVEQTLSAHEARRLDKDPHEPKRGERWHPLT